MSALNQRDNLLEQICSKLMQKRSDAHQNVRSINDELYLESFLIHCMKSKRINENNRVSCIKICLNSGIDVNSTDMEGKTALIIAVMNRSLECAKTLLAPPCDINKRDNTGNTALHYCFKGTFDANINLMRALIQYGADTNVSDNTGITPTFYSLLSYAKIFKLVLSANGDVASFRFRDFQTLKMTCGWKIRNLDYQIFLKRLYYLGCPVTCCKKIAEIYPHGIHTAEWLNELNNNCSSLKEICRTKIRHCLKKQINTRVKELPIPGALQHYILMEDVIEFLEKCL
ncbi:hypothetical protein SNE40_015206 [Patella caerulea]|uniref:SOCS box domain-containing protein n=1 Tax=Patella caerulea TaxID=87958 RepID=A0AAN8PIQ5_PATCE